MKKIILITRVSLLVISSTLIYVVFQCWFLVKTNLDFVSIVLTLIISSLLAGTQLGVLLHEFMRFVTEYKEGLLPSKKGV